MTSITALLKSISMLNYYSLTQTVSLTKLNQKMMFMKNFLNTNTRLTLVNINQSKFFDPTNKKIVGKIKDEYKGIPINEFIRLKSKMYPIFAENNKKSSKAKGVNI